MEKKERLNKQIDGYREQMIEYQRELTSVPAIAPQSGGDGEWEKAELLKKLLKQLAIDDLEQINIPDNRVSAKLRPNIIATIKGESEEKRFWIMTHLDVVPPGDINKWQSDPYSPKLKEGKIYGRGVEDNQQGMISSIFAAATFLKLGIIPYYTVKLLFVADEETGSDYGVKYLVQKRKNLFKKGDFFLVPDAGKEDGTMIEIAEKSLLWLKFQIVGKQCHASTPALGNNAFIAGSKLVLELNELNNIFKQKNPLFEPPFSTFSPTKKESNVPNINTIPGKDVFYLDCRILPELGIDKALKRIRKVIQMVEKQYGVKICHEIIQQEESPPTNTSEPLVATLKRAIKEIYGVDAQPMGIGGGTVAAHIRKQSLSTVVWAKLNHTAHMPNEYCVVDNMIGDAKVMAQIMLEGQ